MSQINRQNVSNLAPALVFNFGTTSRLQTTPIVVGGIIYLAIVWRYRRLLQLGALGNVLRRTRKSRADAAGRQTAGDAGP